MICLECGAENPDGEVFCEFCGAVLGTKLETVQTKTARRAENPIEVDKRTPSASDDGGALTVLFDVLSAWKISFSKYFNRKGRASRTEFWYWHILLLFSIVIPLIFVVMQVLSDDDASFTILEPILDGSFSLLVGALLWLVVWTLVLPCPTVCLYIRRVHDFNIPEKDFLVFFLSPLATLFTLSYVFYDPEILGFLRSYELDSFLGWLNSPVLWASVSFICALIMILVPGLIPGTKGANEYGPRPKKP